MKESMDKINYKTKPREYNAWSNMKQRCTNENRWDFKHYGGRGIKYDPAWESFINFYNDMGDRPEGTTLERLEGNEGYRKDNCVG